MSDDTMTGLPLWRQVAGRLAAAITEGHYPPGSRLPSEATLAAQFAINRHTLRRAMEDLARTGLLTTEQGRGSFVAEHVMDYVVGPRTRFSEWVRGHNREPSGRVLDLRTTAAPAAVATGLGAAVGAAVVMLERLGLADGLPVSLATHWFPARTGLQAALASGASVSEALAAVGVADYRRSRTRVGARLPTASEAALLRTARNQPILECENTNVDGDGQIVEFGVARHPTPRVQVVFEP